MTAKSKGFSSVKYAFAVASILGLVTLRPTKAKEPNIIKVKMDKKTPLGACKGLN